MDLSTTSWVPVELGDVVVDGVGYGWQRALVSGHRVDRTGASWPVLLAVAESGHAVPAPGLPGPGSVRSAVYLEPDSVVVSLEPSGRSLHGCFHCGFEETPEDEHLNRSVASWCVMGDEDPIVVAEFADGVLRAWESGVSAPSEEGVLLRRTGPRDDLVLGAGEITAHVLGVLSEDGAEPAPGWWRTVPDRASGLAWRRVRPKDPPDAWTSILSTIGGPYVAGHRAGRPVVFSADGNELEAPWVRLDAEHPHVAVLSAPRRRPGAAFPAGLEVALQSATEGPQLWTCDGPGRWFPVGLPGRRLQAAAYAVQGGDPWFVIDGRLWRPTGGAAGAARFVDPEVP
jgi:hypothetical protein